MELFLKYGFYLVVLVLLAIPLGTYISKVMNGEKVFLSKIIGPIERLFYKLLHLDAKKEMNWKVYLCNVLMFSLVCLIFLFVLLLVQGYLPGGSNVGSVRVDLAFNTAVSFITNTNWQSYSGENTLSYFVQAIGLCVQNFVSAGVGICVLYGLIRGFCKVKEKGIGNFYQDLVRIVMYVLVPLSIVVSITLMSQGVVQNMSDNSSVNLVETYVDEEGNKIDKQLLPNGSAASQVAIKQLGTNGGGYFGTNSAHPLENPNAFTNFVEVTSLLLIPVALCFSFGRSIKNKKQGRAIFISMFALLVMALGSIAVSEQVGTPALAQSGVVDISNVEQAGGNMEGKEARFGIVGSSVWSAYTTAASNGSVNNMHDSLTPLAGMTTMLLMQLGEIVFGGVGSGLYGMLAFVILTVFIAGLMVGRTPEFLGKKIDPYEMKWAVLACLATPIAILIGSGIATLVPSTIESVTNGGAHAFSQVLYAYTSAGANNGSAFAGFIANTPFVNVSLGLSMLFARFIPIIAVLAIAGNMVSKRKVAISSGTLSTTNSVFVFLLVFVVILIGALSFFPALSLGPIAEFFVR